MVRNVTRESVEIARELAKRLTEPPATADDAVARIKGYLEDPLIGSSTAVALALATIYRWEEAER